MNDAEFQKFADELMQYLEKEKVFVADTKRIAEVNAAAELAREMFPDANITIEEDPLQMGGLFLCIDDFDIVVRETERFAELISKANNFEIYPKADEKLQLNIAFAKAMIKVS